MASLVDPFDSPDYAPSVKAAPQGNSSKSGLVDPFDDPNFGAKPAAPVAATPSPEPGISKTEDVVKSIGTSAIKAPGALLGLPSDAMSAVGSGFQYLLTEGAEKLGLLKPGQAKKIREIGSDYKSPVGSGSINETVGKATAAVGAPLHKAETGAGKAASNFADFVFQGGLGAGSVRQLPGAAVKFGLLPGAVSEGAGQATEGTALEPYARVGGALVGGGIGALRGIKSAPGKILADATKGVTDAEFTAAQKLMDDARAAGSQITLPEALQQVTNGRTGLADVQRVVEQSRQGGPILRDVMADRAGNNAAMADTTLRKSFGDLPANPYEVAPRVQGAAETEVKAAETARTNAVTPMYDAAKTQQVPADRVEGILQRIDDITASDKTGVLSKSLNEMRDILTHTKAKPEVPAIPGTRGRYVDGKYVPATPGTPGVAAEARVPVTDIENLDRARKYLRDKVDLPAIAAEATPKEAGGTINKLLDDLRTEMESASAPFEAGKTEYQRISREVVDPILRSPTGQLATTDAFEKQKQILFDPKPLPGSEKQIGQAVASVVKTDPVAAQNLVNMKIRQSFEEATQNLASGPAQFGGPKFVASLTGNGQQRKNLEAAVRALPNGQVAWDGFNRMLNILEAQGRRQHVGSQTEFNRLLNKDIGSGGVGDVAALMASPGKWWAAAQDAYQQFRYGKNTELFANLFTSPEAVRELRKIAQMSPGSPRTQAVISNLIVSRMAYEAGGMASTQVRDPRQAPRQ